MIDRIANNRFNTEILNLNPPGKIKEKLDYYRSLFNKTQDLSQDEFSSLEHNIRVFFNLKAGGYTEDPPTGLIRISNNNKILSSQGKESGYLTNISQILAPPIELCNYGRCNIPKKQVLYCSISEAGAYWETRPQKGDVITISHFELKPGAKVNCTVIKKEKTLNPAITNQLQEVYYLLEEFFVEAYSLEVERTRPRDYIFSAVLASEMLFYPAISKKNFEAVIYPSVQKKKYGENFAIRNDLILERYNLIGVETRFILDEYENLDPQTDEVTTDQFIASFVTKTFNWETGDILYQEEKANEILELFRRLQMDGGRQTRYEYPGVPKNLAFDLSLPQKTNSMPKIDKTVGRNDRVNVVYQNGLQKDNIKLLKVTF